MPSYFRLTVISTKTQWMNTSALVCSKQNFATTVDTRQFSSSETNSKDSLTAKDECRHSASSTVTLNSTNIIKIKR